MSGRRRARLLVGIAVALLLAMAFYAGMALRRPQLADSGREPQVEDPPPASASGPPRGKWVRAREGAAPAGEVAEALLALPYLQGYRAARGEPVVAAHDPERSWEGLNLLVSGHAPEAQLLDMDGRMLHRWRRALRSVWPDLAENDALAKLEYWRRARLLPNGDLLAIFEGLGLIKLDRDSNLLWAHRGGIHHDLDLTPAGEIWVLDRDGHLVPRVHATKPILEDFATLLDAGGKVLRRVSLLEAFERSAFSELLEGMPPAGDVFHTNTLELLDGRHAEKNPAFRAGNLLVSVLMLDTVAVVDPEREEVVWALADLTRKQHQPTLLENGNVLVFDNLGAGKDRSRILELEPATREIVWQYGGSREVSFFSKTLGSCQRLPNDNTLITESENGRAFEVTPGGEIVWELYNPHRAGENGELIAALFEVVRLPPDFPFQGGRDGPETGE